MAQSFTDDFVADAIGAIPAGWTAVEPGASEFRVRDLSGAHAAKLLDAANADSPQGIRDFGFASTLGYLQIVVRPAQTNAYLAIRTKVKTTGSFLTIYFYATGEIRYVKLNNDGSFQADQFIQGYSANTDYTVRIDWDVALHHGWRVTINGSDKGWLNDAVTQAIDAVEHVRVDGHSATAGTLWTKSLTVNSTSEANVKPNTPTCSVDSVVGSVANLSSSPFSDPNPGDTQAAARWIVRYAGGGAVIEDTGEDAVNLLAYQTTVPLPANASLEAVVLHKDNGGLWSDESAPAPFSTSAWTACAPRPATAWTACPAPSGGGVLEPDQFFTDFAGYALGAIEQHADWSVEGATGWFTVVDAATESGRVLRADKIGPTGYNFARWTEPAGTTAIEAVARMRFVGATVSDRMVFLMLGQGAADHYFGGSVGYGQAPGDPDQERVTEADLTAQYSPLTQDLAFGIASGAWFLVRVQNTQDPDRIRVRVWLDGEDEPGTWDLVLNRIITTLVPFIGYGAGLGPGHSEAGTAEYDWIGVGVDGMVAPTADEAAQSWEPCAAAPTTAWVGCS